jgi:hypothetical protein
VKCGTWLATTTIAMALSPTTARQRTIAMKIGYLERWLGARFVCSSVGIRDWE